MSKNNSKTFGLGKEREAKALLIAEGTSQVTRARGSFGAFDIQAFKEAHCLLISVKSVRQDYWSPNTEIKKLTETPVPSYCKKELWIYWTKNKIRPDKRGWQKISIPSQELNTEGEEELSMEELEEHYHFLEDEED